MFIIVNKLTINKTAVNDTHTFWVHLVFLGYWQQIFYIIMLLGNTLNVTLRWWMKLLNKFKVHHRTAEKSMWLMSLCTLGTLGMFGTLSYILASLNTELLVVSCTILSKMWPSFMMSLMQEGLQMIMYMYIVSRVPFGNLYLWVSVITFLLLILHWILIDCSCHCA